MLINTLKDWRLPDKNTSTIQYNTNYLNVIVLWPRHLLRRVVTFILPSLFSFPFSSSSLPPTLSQCPPFVTACDAKLFSDPFLAVIRDLLEELSPVMLPRSRFNVGFF